MNESISPRQTHSAAVFLFRSFPFSFFSLHKTKMRIARRAIRMKEQSSRKKGLLQEDRIDIAGSLALRANHHGVFVDGRACIDLSLNLNP